MGHQILTEDYPRHQPISFELLAGQSIDTCSIGSWKPVSMSASEPETFFRVPIDKRYEFIDIIQTKKLGINLLFSYVKNGCLNNIKFNVNNACVINNPLKAKLKQPIILNPLDTIEFIAYPVSSPSKAIPEIVTLELHVYPVPPHMITNQPNPFNIRYSGCSQTKTSQFKKP